MCVGGKLLQSHYSVLVRNMPDDYKSTVSKLECHLTGDNIGSILECEDVFTANQRILDCLIEQINTKEGLLDFFEQLNSIPNAPALTAVVENVKKGTQILNGQGYWADREEYPLAGKMILFIKV